MSFYQIIGIVLALFLMSCQAKQQPAGSEPSQKDESETLSTASPAKSENLMRIVCFGNSLTAGYGLDTDQSFPSLLQKRIDSLNLPYLVVNAGVSGETSSGGLHRIEWILSQPVEIFILELGANDALRGLDLTATRQNLQGIVDHVREKYPACKIIIAGMKAPPNMGTEYTTEFEKIFIELADQNETDLLPFLLEGVAAQPELNLPDGIHPNVDGQKIVMENVWEELAPHLEASF